MFERYVALRYLNSKRKGLFSIITTVIGIAGVAVGVAALITTLAVMTGFQEEIKGKIMGAQSHIVTLGFMDEPTYKESMDRILTLPKVTGVAPHIYGQAIATHRGASNGMILRGIDYELEKTVSSLLNSFTEGSETPPLKEGEEEAPAGIILGEALAQTMQVFVGSDIVLISPSSISTSAGVFPKMKKFRVAGIIKTGYFEFDNTIGYTSLEHARDFLNMKKGVSSLAVKMKKFDDAEKGAAMVAEALDYKYEVKTVAQLNSTFYAALKLEKTVMFIILFLIIIVASLNIASNLILLGTEKLRDIGIMRAMGATPGQIKKIFIYEGVFIATAGIALGLILAFILCWAIATFNIVDLPPDIYYLTKVPVNINVLDVLAVIAGSYAVCFCAALYPALRAGKVNPTEAIRYG